MGRRLLAALAVVAGLLVAAQLLLPGLAERRVRGELDDHGRVTRVEVDAFPAVKLLFGRADRLEARVSGMRLADGRLADLLSRTAGVGELDVRADSLHVGPLLVREVALTKAGDRLRATAALSDADLRAALPAELGLRPLESGPDGLVLEVMAGGFAVRARLAAAGGALVIAPDGLLSALARLTLFEDPRVRVTGVGAQPRPGGFVLTADGRVA